MVSAKTVDRNDPDGPAREYPDPAHRQPLRYTFEHRAVSHPAALPMPLSWGTTLPGRLSELFAGRASDERTVARAYQRRGSVWAVDPTGAFGAACIQ